MKKIAFLLVLLLLPVMVYAEDYDVKTLIPVDTKASIKTEKFDYNNLIYNSNIDSKGNSLITFESVKNNYATKSFISINVLLFGEDQKNIGFLTYCTDKDLDSNYSDYELAGNGSVPFSINVVSKYFIEGKSTKDVKYISVLDDNKYCQVGGYDKYKGLTLDEIVNGVNNKKDDSGINKYINSLKDNGVMTIVIIVLVSIAGLVILIMIISSILKSAKNNKYKTIEKIKSNDNVSIEETVDLSYDKVDDDGFDNDSSISMGEVNNNIEINENDNKDDEEDDGDLTSFFN